MVRITELAHGSRAAKAKIKKDDLLVRINGEEIRDVLDYRFYLANEEIELDLIRDKEKYSVKIVKDTYDDIGLDFETPLMDKKHSCTNKCVFCFIDQLPKGMRETLYFKDDDSRLSFLHGNYITLTNLFDEDIDRIVKMHISPINISIHTMNPELRVEMMHNKRAGTVLKYLDKLTEAGLTIRGQIVLCRSINDGEELKNTMVKLAKYYPMLDSVSIVPAGLTDHREGLYPLTQFTREEAKNVVDSVNEFGNAMMRKYGVRLFYLADEFYLKAGRPIPEESYYDGYPQLENGVGMIRSFCEEFDTSIETLSKIKVKRKRHVSIATGVAAYPIISDMANKLSAIYPNLTVDVYEIINDYFGHEITVSGLMTGADIYNQLKDKHIGKYLMLPDNCLREGEDVFLCGMTVKELEKKLKTKIITNSPSGEDFINGVTGNRRK